MKNYRLLSVLFTTGIGLSAGCGLNTGLNTATLTTAESQNAPSMSEEGQDLSLTSPRQAQVMTEFRKLFRMVQSYKGNYGSYPIVARATAAQNIRIGWVPPTSFKYDIKIISNASGWAAMACSKIPINGRYDCHRLNGNSLVCTPFDAYAKRSAILKSLPRNPAIECAQTSAGNVKVLPVLVRVADFDGTSTWVPPWIKGQNEVKTMLNGIFLAMQAYQANYSEFPLVATTSSPLYFRNIGVNLPYNASYIYSLVSKRTGFAVVGCSMMPVANGKIDCWRMNEKKHMCAPFDAVLNRAAIVDPTGKRGCEQTASGKAKISAVLTL